jgi:PKD repeat protein
MKKMYSLLTLKQGVLLFVGIFVFLLSHQAKAQCPDIDFSETSKAICHNTELHLSDYFQLTDATGIVGYTWTTSGSGNFYPPNYLVTTPSLIYVPSANDILAGSVTLTVEIIPDTALTACTTVEKTFDLTIYPDPKVDFTWTGGSCIDELITFTAVSDATPPVTFNDCRWDFPDGQIASEVTVSKAFTYPGEHLVKLTVTANGCQMPPVSKNVSIKSKPTAVFTFDKPSCNEVLFHDYSYPPAGSQITLREWDFEGDGVVDETHTVAAPTVPHIYGVGIFNPTLRVVTNDGCEAIFSSEISIKEAPLAAFNVTSGFCMGTPTEFECTTQIPTGGSPISYHWNFGDPMSGANNTSTDAAPQHAFTAAGSYEVKLVITNAEGCSDEAIQNITIESGTDIQIQPDVAEPYCAGQTIVFNVDATGLTNYQWSVNGTLESSQSVFSHYFYEQGTYTVSVSAEEAGGCRSTANYSVHIHAKPSSEFTVDVPSCPNEPVQFNYIEDANYNDINSWEWKFGDEGTQTIRPPMSPDVTYLFRGLGPHTVTLTTTTDNCESVTAYTVVLNQPSVTAAFSIPAPTVCAGNEVTFQNHTAYTPTTAVMEWQWTVTDQATGTVVGQSTDEDLVYTFANSGSYSISLLATNTQTGCSSTKPATGEAPILIQVTDQPVASITASATEVCLGEPITFTAAPEGATFTWDFGDGTTAPNLHIYEAAGTYMVTLIASTNGCASEPVEQQVIVRPNPVSSFEHDAPVCEGDVVTFTSTTQSSDPIDTYSWYFGEGLTGGSNQVTHSYSGSGTFYATLTTTTTFGCSNESPTQEVQINIAPTAGFTVSGSCAESEITFTADESFSNDPDNPIESYVWTFNDGYTREGYSITRSDMEEGTYTVTLTVRNANTECEASLTEENVAITEAVDYAITVDEELYEAPLTYKKCVGTSVNFAFEQSSGDNIAWYTWDFGDGTSSPQQPPTQSVTVVSHRYDEARVEPYQVTLTVHTENGCERSTSFYVKVSDAPTARFTIDTPTANTSCTDQKIVFTDSSLPGSDDPNNYITELTWNFTDSTELLPGVWNDTITHLFKTPKTYDVVLKVKDNIGCEATSTLPVTIISNSEADFDLDTEYPAGCFNLHFLDKSTPHSSRIKSWEWNFNDIGNPEPSLLKDPAHLFSEPGEYQVALKITNEIGCVDDTIKPVTVDYCSKASFRLENVTSDAICAATEVLFFNDSEIGLYNEKFVSYKWNWGDGSEPTTIYDKETRIVPHTYKQGGEYTVRLTLTLTINGKTYELYDEQTFIVNPQPTAILEPNISVCYNNEVTVMDQSVSNSTDESMPITTWIWTFGANSPITEYQQGITYLFDNKEVQNVQLKVSNEKGCFSDEITASITYENSPVIDFTVSDSCAQKDFEFEVIVENEIPIKSYQWNFGDGTTSEQLLEPYATHSFAKEGPNEGYSYNVTLVVESDGGCFAETTKPVTVYPAPFVDFRYTENVDGKQGNYQFENLSQNAILYNWIFNAKDTLTETNPLYLFGTDSPNIVELIAWNQQGCSISKVDTIKGLTFYGLYFPNAFLPDSENPEINRFTGKGVNLLEYRVEVFSNWGQLLWSSEKLENGSPSETWDGTYNGEKVPMGSYIWRATAKFVDGSVWNGSDNGDGNIKKFGIINLIR